MKFRCYLAILGPLLCCGPLLAQTAPPPAPVRPVTDDYFGTKIVDPYRWMEETETKNPELTAWMKAQNSYTRAMLDSIPGRQKLFERVRELDDTVEFMPDVKFANGGYFYLTRRPGQNVLKLYTRAGLRGEERLLVDPERGSSSGQHLAINYFEVSQDGEYVLYGIAPGGSEDTVIRVMEVKTGQDLTDRIDRARFNGFPGWLPDNRSFVYNRTRKIEPGDAPQSWTANSRMYLHKLGADPDSDTPVFGRGVSAAVDIAPGEVPIVTITPGSRFAVAEANDGVGGDLNIYAAPLSSLRDKDVKWTKVIGKSDRVKGWDIHEDDLYVRSHRRSQRLEVRKIDLNHADATNSAIVVPPSEAVVTNIAVAHDALYVQKLDGGIARLFRIPFGERSAAQEIVLPVKGTLFGLQADPRVPGVLLGLISWTVSAQYFQYDPQANVVADTKLMMPSSADFSQIEATEVKVQTKDGTWVPLSIIARRGIKKDGTHPTLIEAYGSYGISITPFYNVRGLAWLERGGILAVAHVRGGGEYGEDWHEAGRKLTKQNTISDFIVCAQYLIDQKYTSSQHLAGKGTSAGGITIGGAITQRPDLFAAALSEVGMNDALRFELTRGGLANANEFGSTKTPDGFRGLYAMSAYHHVKEGTPYPAVLLTTGMNDSRVPSWEVAKMTARLQAASSSGKPVLLRVDFDSGHGMGATKTQLNAKLADEYAFLLWQLGNPDFQVTQSAGTK